MTNDDIHILIEHIKEKFGKDCVYESGSTIIITIDSLIFIISTSAFVFRITTDTTRFDYDVLWRYYIYQTICKTGFDGDDKYVSTWLTIELFPKVLYYVKSVPVELLLNYAETVLCRHCNKKAINDTKERIQSDPIRYSVIKPTSSDQTDLLIAWTRLYAKSLL